MVEVALALQAHQEFRAYLGRMGVSTAQMADRLHVKRRTLMDWHSGLYQTSEEPLAATILAYIRAHPPRVPRKPGTLYETANVRVLDDCIRRARRGEWCLVFGAPGTQKSFVFETRLAESFTPAGEAGIVYVYASAGMSSSALLKEIARGLGTLAQGHRHQIISNILYALSERPQPPALIVDEAHHLGGKIETLEILREIGDRGRIGMVVAGHDDLGEIFHDDARAPLEQWRSRFDRRVRLPGLKKDEIDLIARAELGDVSDAALHKLRHGCEVAHRSEKYLSVRTLLKIISQVREGRPRSERSSQAGTAWCATTRPTLTSTGGVIP